NGLYIVGLDGHIGYHIPTFCMAFFLELTAVHPFAMGSKFHPKVQFNGGTPSVTDKHVSRFLWPHLGFSPDPLNLLTPLEIITGTQETWLPRLQVLIEGIPAAPTVLPGPLSINVNCWAFGKLPTNLVIQPGTVQTTPTGADYAYGAIRWAVNLGISVLLFFVSGGFGKVGQEIPINEFLEQQLTKMLFKNPLDPKNTYGFLTAATGFDPGQAAASAIVGQGPGSSISAKPAAAASNVIPAFGYGYNAGQVGSDY